MAGAIGGGGWATWLSVCYQRFRGDVMLQTVILLVILVQAMQMLGDWAANYLNDKYKIGGSLCATY